MKVSVKQLPSTPDEVCTLLQSETDTFGTFFSLDRILYHEGRYLRAANTRYPEFWALAGDPYIICTQKPAVQRILMSRFNVEEYKLRDKDGKQSIAQAVVEKLLKDGELSQDARRFLQLYKEIAEAEYMASYLGQYKNLPISVCEDMDNNRMVIAHPAWRVLSTSRFSASRPSVQNISRDVCDIYTAPKGWQLVFSDSGQIEPRITYSAYIQDELIKQLIIAYDDAYFGLLHYIQLSPEEEARLRENLSLVSPHEVTQEMQDKRKRLKVLGLAGNYGSSNLAEVDRELGPLYEQKIVRHPARLQWEREVRDSVRHGTEVFYGYFGTAVRPDSTAKYQRGDNSWVKHLIRCGINNPIQTTAAELMCLSVLAAKRLLGPQDHIGSYKHDEGMFYVKEDSVDEMAPKLRDCLSYEIPDWIPIGSDLHVGRKESPYAPDIL